MAGAALSSEGLEASRATRRLLRRLARASLWATIVLVGVGGYTRASGSGLGCGERWPLCEGGPIGGLVPGADVEMIVEWSHRWLAAVVGMLVVATAVSAWRVRPRDDVLVFLTATGVAVLGVQAWLGREVVANGLDAKLVTLHLATAFALLGLLACIDGRARAAGGFESGRLQKAGSVGSWSLAGAMLVAATSLLGASVRGRYFAGWPLMEDGFPGDTWAALHFAHRLTAAAALVVAGCVLARASSRSVPRGVRRRSAAAGGAVLLQLFVGLLHVVTELGSPVVAALHLVLAAGAWAAYLSVWWDSRELSRQVPPAVDATRDGALWT